jgi:hypothetical protein
MLAFTLDQVALPFAMLVCVSVGAAVAGWVVAARSRSRRLQSDLILARQQELSLDLICTASFDGFFVQLNPSWTRVLGF